MLNYLTRALRGDAPSITPKMRAFRERVATQRAREAEHIARLQLAAGTSTIGPSPLSVGQAPEPAPAAPAVNSRGIPLTLPTGLEAVQRAKANAASTASSGTVSRAQQVIKDSEDLWDTIYARELASSGPPREVEFDNDRDLEDALELGNAIDGTRGSERYQRLQQLRGHIKGALATGKAQFVGDPLPADAQRMLNPGPEHWRSVEKLIALRDSGATDVQMRRMVKSMGTP